MTTEIAIVLGLLALAMVLFTTELLPVDVVSLGLVAALIASSILTPAAAFDAFGSEVIVILPSIMILAGAIVKAGVMAWLRRRPMILQAAESVFRSLRSSERRPSVPHFSAT